MRRALPDAAAAVGTLLVAASAWLFWPRERTGDSPALPQLRVVLVDTSASAVWRNRNWSEWVEQVLRSQRSEAIRVGEEFALVLYGDEVKRIGELGESLPPPFASSGVRHAFLRAGWASRLSAALEVSLELVKQSGRGRGRVVLVGDGTYTGTDPRPALDQLAQAGAVLVRLDLPPSDLEEIVPGALDLPDEVEVGAPIAASFDVFYSPGSSPPKSIVAVSIENQFRDTESWAVPAIPVPASAVPDEDGYLRWHVRAEGPRAREGLNVITVRGQRPSIGANDVDLGVTSQGVVRGAGKHLVALVKPGPGWHEQRPMLASPFPADTGLEVAWIWQAELAAELERFDALVTFDIPLDELPIPILRSFVERGGGWLAMIGSDSLSSFIAGSAVDVLPLAPQNDDPETRDVIFVVDRSGSMTGERSESVRRAVFALMDEALPGDTVELRWFADELSPAIPLISMERSRRPSDREEARRLAADRVFATEMGGGPTALLKSLEELAQARAASGREALVFLLSDGRDNTDSDPVANAPLVLDRLRATRARLVVIAAGSGADRELLSRFVAADQMLEEVDALLESSKSSVLRGLFQRELNRDRVREGSALRIMPAETPAGPGAEILQAMRPDLARDWPAIRSYVRAKRAPGADVLWVSETGDPLLAVQRVGLGLTAACAFSVTPPLKQDPDSAMGERLAPLLRALARGQRSSRPNVRVERDEFVVHGLPVDTPAEIEARLFTADAQESDPPLIVIELGPPIEGDPRRVRRGIPPASAASLSMLWEGTEALARTARIEIRARGTAGTSWTPIQLALSPPRSVEFVLPRPRIPPFETIAVDRSESSVVRSKPHPSAPWILLSGLLLLAGAGFAGTFSRRVR